VVTDNGSKLKAVPILGNNTHTHTHSLKNMPTDVSSKVRATMTQ